MFRWNKDRVDPVHEDFAMNLNFELSEFFRTAIFQNQSTGKLAPTNLRNDSKKIQQFLGILLYYPVI